MAGAAHVEVRVDGLRDFIRRLREMNPEIDEALRVEFKSAGSLVARQAARNVARRTGALAGSYRVRVRRYGVLVGSPRVEAPIIEFGKRSHQRSGRGPNKTYIRRLTRQTPLIRATERAEPFVRSRVEKALSRAVVNTFGAEASDA